MLLGHITSCSLHLLWCLKWNDIQLTLCVTYMLLGYFLLVDRIWIIRSRIIKFDGTPREFTTGVDNKKLFSTTSRKYYFARVAYFSFSGVSRFFCFVTGCSHSILLIVEEKVLKLNVKLFWTKFVNNLLRTRTFKGRKLFICITGWVLDLCKYLNLVKNGQCHADIFLLIKIDRNAQNQNRWIFIFRVWIPNKIKFLG